MLAGCAANPAVRNVPASPDPGGVVPRPAEPRRSRAASSAVGRLQHDLAAVFSAPLTAHAQWAVDIRSLDTGERLYGLNAGKLMMPASNMKILTVAAAADVLGWDACLTTTLETSAPVEDGVLRGDLIVRGSGDPTI